MFFHVLSCSFIFLHFLSCSFMFFHVLSCSFIFLHFLSFSFIFFHFLSFSFMFFHFLSFSFILFHFLIVLSFSFMFFHFLTFSFIFFHVLAFSLGISHCVATGMMTNCGTRTTCITGASVTLSKKNWGIPVVRRAVWTMGIGLCTTTGKICTTCKQGYRSPCRRRTGESLWSDVQSGPWESASAPRQENQRP